MYHPAAGGDNGGDSAGAIKRYVLYKISFASYGRCRDARTCLTRLLPEWRTRERPCGPGRIGSALATVPPVVNTAPDPRDPTPAPGGTARDRELFILGVTHDGRTFRPSDWAERLAGVMSRFRPEGAGSAGRLAYSPYCLPTVLDGIKCVVVREAVREIEPMAWDFVMNFARDNQLQVVEACLVPDEPPSSG